MREPSSGTLPKTWSARFELRGELGTGSMGVVHRVFDRQIGREVALKTLRTNSPELFYLLKEEFRAAASVLHPNLVELYELFVEGKQCFFTMELLDALPLDAWFGRAARDDQPSTIDALAELAREHPTLTWAESGTVRLERTPENPAASPPPRRQANDASARLASVAAQLFRAVSALHDAGRIHCDLKPSNIMVTASGRLCVLDFGLSAPLWGQFARSGFSGTLAYAAPEQMWGGELTPAADWYSVGVVLFEALTGRLPEGEAQIEATLERAWSVLQDQAAALLPRAFPGLVASLLRLEPTERPKRDAIARVFAPPAEAHEPTNESERRFVGRARELTKLHVALQAARSGWLSVVDVCGDSGMGKTELIRQFTLQAVGQSVLVARGQCRLDESVAYQAIDRVIDDLMRHLLLMPEPERRVFLPDDFSSLVRVFPVLGRLVRLPLPPLDDPTSDDATAIRQRAVLALQQMLWRLCAWRPLLLWVDDVQWGDAESQSLLAELLREPAPPLLLILSHREPDLPWLAPIAEAVARAQGQWIELGTRRLDRTESVALAEALLGELGPSRPSLVERVVSESDGVPLFIGQLCRWVGESAQPELSGAEPLRLDHVIERRIAALDVDERRVAELAALIQTPLAVDVVAAAAGLPTGGARVVPRLASAQLLRLTGPRPDPRLTSFHEHVRESILSRLDAPTRQRSHARIARAIERLDPSVVPEVLLHHWLEAGETQRAREVALRAAHAAMDQLAFNHAAALYRSALDLLEVTSPEHPLVHAQLARALSAAGRAVEAGERYRLLSERSSSAESLHWQQLAAEHFLTGGALEQGLAMLQQALGHVGLKSPASNALALLHGLRQALAFRLSRRVPGQLVADGFRQPGLTPNPALVLQSDLCLSAAKGLGVVDPILSLYFALTALRLAARSADPSRLASAQCLAGCMLACAGGVLGRWGRDWLDDAARFADASGDRVLRARLLACEAQVDVNRGHWVSVLQHCEAATRWLERSRDAPTWERNMIEVAALRALEERGELKQSWQRAAIWRLDAQNRGDLYALTTADLYLAFARLGENDPDQAEHVANRALERWSASPPPFQELYRCRLAAYAELYRGRLREALARYEQTLATARTARLDRFPMLVLETSLLCARIHLQMAAANAALGKPFAASERTIKHSIKRLASLGREDATAHAELLGAGVQALRGEQAAAEQHLRAARELFNRQQMALGLVYCAVAEAALKQLPRAAPEWQACEASLRAQGIVCPEAWLAVFAPGARLR